MSGREQILTAAGMHLAAGRRREAEMLYADLAERFPGDPGGATGLGLMALEERQTGRALDLLGTAASMAPDNADAVAALGLAYRQDEKPEQAEDCFRRAVQLDPRHLSAATNLAILLAERGETDEAEALLLEVVTADPDAAEALHMLAVLRMDRGDGAAAEAYLRRTLEADPEHRIAANNLALVLARTERHDQAVPIFEDLLLAEPSNAAFAINAGQALLPVGRAADAVRLLRRALTTQPKSPELLAALGHAQLATGEIETAVKSIGDALRLAPKNEALYLALATALRHAGRPGQAVKMLRMLEGMTEAKEAVRPILADSLLADGQWREGWSLLTGETEASADPEVWDLTDFDRNAVAVLRYLPDSGEASRPVLRVDPVFQDLTVRLTGGRAVFEGGPAAETGPAATPLEVLARYGDTPDTLPAPIQIRERRERPEGAPFSVAVIPMVDPAPDWVAQGALPIDPLLAALREVTTGILLIARGDDLPSWVEQVDPFTLPPEELIARLGECDAIVGGDNLICHLAACAGLPVELLLPSFADGRWLAGRADTPWYPSVRLHRQVTPGDWADPIGSMVAALTTE